MMFIFSCRGSCDTSHLTAAVLKSLKKLPNVSIQSLPGIGEPFTGATAAELQAADKVLVINGCNLRCIQDYYFRDLKADFEIFTLSKIGIIRGEVAAMPDAFELLKNKVLRRIIL